jgi:hypothetical protein
MTDTIRQPSDQPAPAKPEWSAPTLTVLGGVGALTENSLGSISDAGTNQS